MLRSRNRIVEMAKEIPQGIDVEKLMDEDVDDMILETDIDGDSGVRCCRLHHGVPRRRLHRDSGGGTAQDQDGCKMHGGW